MKVKNQTATVLKGPRDVDYLEVIVAANGAIVSRVHRHDGSMYGTDRTVVFNSPQEFGEWMRQWMEGRLTVAESQK